MNLLRDDLGGLQAAEWERLSGHSVREASALHAAIGHILRGYRYLELIHVRHIPTARRYKELLGQLIGKVDPAFEGGTITYDEEMASMDAEMGDLLDLAHVDLETFFLFAKTVLDRVAQYVELYFGAEPKLAVRSHEKLQARFNEYAVRRGMVVPDELPNALAHVHDLIFLHPSNAATNDARVLQSPTDLMIAHTDNHPGPNGSPGITRLSLTTGQLLAVVDAYLRTIIELVRQNPSRARILHKHGTPAAITPDPAARRKKRRVPA